MKKIFVDEKENKKLFQHDIKKRFFIFVQNNFPLLFLILAIYFYILSLERCRLDSESECYKLFFPKIGQLLFRCIFSSFLFSLNYILPLIYKSSTTIITFFLTFISQFLLYLADDGTNFQSHGSYNRILLVMMTIIFIIIELITISIILFYKNNNKFFSFLLFGIVFLYLIFIYISKFTSSCDYWQKGLKGSNLDNEKNCKLMIPKTCWLFIFDGILDFSKMIGLDCKTNKENASVEEYYKNAKIIAFPETQLFNFTQRSYRYLQKNVLENMIDISNLDPNEQNEFEVVLDRSNMTSPQIKININKENLLIEQKQKILNSLYDNQPLVDNVLIIFVDAISRPQFKQKLPLVYEWFEKYYENKTSTLESFQFFKYNSPIPNTQLSLGPILSGTHPNKRDIVNRLIYNHFKDKGFITAQGIDFCNALPFNYEHNDTNIFQWENFDYEFFSLFCDPNFTVYGKDLGITQGPYSIYRRCLYGKDAFEYVLEFGDKFWNTYYNQKKFLHLSFIDGHEFTLEAIKYLDKPLRNFLDKNEKSFETKNTAIIFLSDHGLHMNGFGNALNLDDLIIELNLPSLFILLPRYIADSKEGENLKNNENSIISNYDIYNFFQDLAATKQFSKYGDSMFNNLLIQTRLCLRDLTIADHNCRCFYPE